MEIMLAMKMKRSPRWARILRMECRHFQFSRSPEVQGPSVQGMVEKRSYNARV